MLSEEQKTQLAQPLDASLVKQRKQGGRNVSYIEGHIAKRHANGIFGFDGWQYEVAMLQEVYLADHESKGKVQRKAGYIAKVRVTVDNVVREDVGFGSGFGVDDCDAVEGAIKEAVTDALKRALVSFGDQFGLGLYGGGNASLGQQKKEDPQDQQQQEPTFREWFDGQIAYYREALGDAFDAEVKRLGVNDLEALSKRGEAMALLDGLRNAVDRQAAGGLQ